ncbi:MAG: flagellar hook-basal body complex protein [Planctomycetota bacterium]
MGLTTAMYTGLSGLNANQTRVETIGHNIANVNTTAFKGSRTLFQTQFAQTMSMGTPPSATSGGTNPLQIGLGTLVGTTQRMNGPGAVETTGLPGDMAIEGGGYFVVDSPGGGRYFTRDGSFALNSQHELVSSDGFYLQGYGVDQNFAIIPGQLQNLVLPIGQLEISRPTQQVQMDGDLSAAETIATQGTQHSTQALLGAGGGPADGAALLTDLRAAGGPEAALFVVGDVLTLSGATRGGRELPPQTFTVGTTGSTLGELAAWLQSALGIQTGEGLPGSPGITIVNGQLVVRGNAGEPNALGLGSSNLMSSNASVGLPLQFTQDAEATGGGVFTSFSVYDSLGNPVHVNATFTLDSTPGSGPVWRYYLEAPDAPLSSRQLGSGTLSFDTRGNYVSATGNQVSLDRSGSGAISPLVFTLDFSALNGLSTQMSDVIMADQDGFPPGTLNGYSIGVDGTITGTFSNGMSRTLGQVVLATFANEAGLVAESDNLYSVGPNSGPAAVVTPGTQAAGLIRGGALETSNVDLAREFIGLITASTAFQANSRVISISSEMLDQLLLAMR